MLQVTGARVTLLAITLEQPFRLGFGTLHALPRVLVRLDGELGGRPFSGIGEASIDFPFVGYDTWDVYATLAACQLVGSCYPSAESVPFPSGPAGTITPLPPLPFDSATIEACAAFPAALAALTMASDDLWGRAYGRSLANLSARRRGGAPLISIGFERPDVTARQAESILARGCTPKVKLGRSVEADVACLAAVRELVRQRGYRQPCLSADFNATYTLDGFMQLSEAVGAGESIWHPFVTLEQPLSANSSWSDFGTLRRFMTESLGWRGELVADESVVTVADALRSAESGWSINYKVQKVGGIRQAVAMSFATAGRAGMVGGTFPTAIGRAYDMWVAATLPCATLPSDAWEPSSDWFRGPLHLIEEQFDASPTGEVRTFDGPGLGVNVNWSNVDPLVVPDPRREYAAIRSGRSGERLHIELLPGRRYGELYAELSGRQPDWNLELETAT